MPSPRHPRAVSRDESGRSARAQKSMQPAPALEHGIGTEKHRNTSLCVAASDPFRPILAQASSESSDLLLYAPCISEGLGNLDISWPCSCTSVSSSGCSNLEEVSDGRSRLYPCGTAGEQSQRKHRVLHDVRTDAGGTPSYGAHDGV